METKTVLYKDQASLTAFIEAHRYKEKNHVLVQVFAGHPDRRLIESIVAQIAFLLPQACIIGATTAGEIMNGKVSTKKTVLSFSTFKYTRIETGLFEPKDGQDDYALGQMLAAKLVKQDTKLLFVFTDGLHVNLQALSAGISSAGKEIALAGGGAGDGGHFLSTSVFTERGMSGCGVAAAALSGAALSVHQWAHCDWKRAGKTFTVTKAEQNRVYTIDGIRIDELYEMFLGKAVAKKLPGAFMQFPLMLVREGKETIVAGKRLFSDGSLLTSPALQNGDRVQFAFGDHGKFLSSAGALIDRVQKQPAEAMFIYSGMAVRHSFRQSLEIEMAPLHSIAPLSGFFTYGEFSTEEGKRVQARSHSVTVTALSEKTGKSGLGASSGRSDVATHEGYLALSELVRASAEELAYLNKSLEESEQRYKSLFEHHPDVIYSLDRRGKITSANPALEQELGYTLEETYLTNSEDYIAPEELSKTNRHFKKALRGEPQHYPLKIRHKSGKLLLFDVTNIPIVVNGEIVGVYGIARNITKQKEDQEKMIRLAYYDELTDLPNRLLFQQMLESSILDAKKRNARLAVVFMDVDRFKMINDSVGHDVGDKILKRATDRMKKALGKRHFLSRFNGDEFVLLLPDVKSEKEAAAAAKQMVHSLRPAIAVDGREFYLSLSAGISIFPDDGREAETILKNADTALYYAKQYSRGNIRMYHEQMNDSLVDQFELEGDLRKALKNGEFFLVYQPQICTKTGRISGSEALLRWKHPKYGAVSPDRFIPLAEETGLIHDIGRWVLFAACTEAKKWQESGHSDCWVSVNVSARQFQRADFVNEVKTALCRTRLPAHCLHLELTENLTLRDVHYSLKQVKALRSLGVKVSIDDFGTGYSSLSYLKDFSIDTLKIDRSFIRNLKKNNKDAAIIQAILTMCKGLSIHAVAEGVESREQLEVLESFGCCHVQGYYYSKPLDPRRFSQYLKEKNFPVSS